MQLLHDLILVAAFFPGKPAVEVLGIAENVWEQKVEQRPQLVQIILSRKYECV